MPTRLSIYCRDEPPSSQTPLQILDALLSLRALRHPNLSPVVINDVFMKGTPVPALTIPIYENGDIHSFLRRNPNVDRLALVCIPVDSRAFNKILKE